MKKRVALCVAEKPTVARSVAEFLSRGKFNKVIYSIEYPKVIVSISFEIQSHIRVRLPNKRSPLSTESHICKNYTLIFNE